MEDSDYKCLMSKQEHRHAKNTPSTAFPSKFQRKSPSTKEIKKSLGSSFTKDSDHSGHSSFCSLLNQHLPEELKVNPASTGPKLWATIQAMSEEGTLPNDEIMEEVLIERQLIAQVESDYT